MLRYSESDQAVIDRTMATLEELSKKYAGWAQEHSGGDPLKAEQLYMMWMDGPQRQAVKIMSMLVPVYFVMRTEGPESANAAKGD